MRPPAERTWVIRYTDLPGIVRLDIGHKAPKRIRCNKHTYITRPDPTRGGWNLIAERETK